MKVISPEKQQELDEHLNAAARIMYEHTEPNKLKNFESIEWELREQILSKVSPKIAEFFLGREREDVGQAKNSKEFSRRSNNQSKSGKKAGIET